jgi:hypothetical protein
MHDVYKDLDAPSHHHRPYLHRDRAGLAPGGRFGARAAPQDRGAERADRGAAR